MEIPSLEFTLNFVSKVHAGQLYNDEPYVFHLVRVASQVEGLEKKTIALLHDILEDTKTTIDDLYNMGYSDAIVGAICILTHDTKNIEISYPEYISIISKFPVESEIKRADVTDHRNNLHKVKDANRRNRLEAKYTEAWGILNTL